MVNQRITLTQKYDPRLKGMDLNHQVKGAPILKARVISQAKNTTGDALKPHAPFTKSNFSNSFLHIVARQTLMFLASNPTMMATAIRDSFFYGLGNGAVSDRPENWREFKDADKKLDKLNQVLIKRNLPSLKKMFGFDPRVFFNPSLQAGNSDVYDENGKPCSATIENGTRYFGLWETIFGVADTQEYEDGKAGGVERVSYYPRLQKIVNFCRFIGFVQAVGEDEELKQAVALALGAWLAYAAGEDPSIAAQEPSKGSIILQDDIKYPATTDLTWPALRRVLDEVGEGRLTDEKEISYTVRHATRLMAQASWYFIGEAESQRLKAPPIYLLGLSYLITMPVDRQVFVKLFLMYITTSVIHHVKFTRVKQLFGFITAMFHSPAINTSHMPESMKGMSAMFHEKWEFGPFKASREGKGKGTPPVQSKNLINLYMTYDSLAFLTGLTSLATGLPVGEWQTQTGLMINVFWQAYSGGLTIHAHNWQKRFEQYEEFAVNCKDKLPLFVPPAFPEGSKPSEEALIRLRIQALEALAQTDKAVKDFRKNANLPKGYKDFFAGDYRQAILRYLAHVDTGILALGRCRLAEADINKATRDENLARGLVLVQMVQETTPGYSVSSTADMIMASVKIDATDASKHDTKIVAAAQENLREEYKQYYLQYHGWIMPKQLSEANIGPETVKKLLSNNILSKSRGLLFTEALHYSFTPESINLTATELKINLINLGASQAEIAMLADLHETHQANQQVRLTEQVGHFSSNYHSCGNSLIKNQLEQNFRNSLQRAGIQEEEINIFTKTIKENKGQAAIALALLAVAAPNKDFNYLARIALKTLAKQSPAVIKETITQLESEVQAATKATTKIKGILAKLINQLTYIEANLATTLESRRITLIKTEAVKTAKATLKAEIAKVANGGKDLKEFEDNHKAIDGLVFAAIKVLNPTTAKPGEIALSEDDFQSLANDLQGKISNNIHNLYTSISTANSSLDKITLSSLGKAGTAAPVLLQGLIAAGYIDSNGVLQPKFDGDKKTFRFDIGGAKQVGLTVEKKAFDLFGNQKDEIFSALEKAKYLNEKGGLQAGFDGNKAKFKLEGFDQKTTETVFNILLNAHQANLAFNVLQLFTAKSQLDALNNWKKLFAQLLIVKHEKAEIRNLTTIHEKILGYVAFPLAAAALSPLTFAYHLVKGAYHLSGWEMLGSFLSPVLTYYWIYDMILPFNYHQIENIPHSKAFNAEYDPQIEEVETAKTIAIDKIADKLIKDLTDNAYDPLDPSSPASQAFKKALRATYEGGYKIVYAYLNAHPEILDKIIVPFTQKIKGAIDSYNAANNTAPAEEGKNIIEALQVINEQIKASARLGFSIRGAQPVADAISGFKDLLEHLKNSDQAAFSAQVEPHRQVLTDAGIEI
ncbi:MAG: hypothetical protein ABIH50_04835 [bacterium]